MPPINSLFFFSIFKCKLYPIKQVDTPPVEGEQSEVKNSSDAGDAARKNKKKLKKGETEDDKKV